MKTYKWYIIIGAICIIFGIYFYAKNNDNTLYLQGIIMLVAGGIISSRKE